MATYKAIYNNSPGWSWSLLRSPNLGFPQNIGDENASTSTYAYSPETIKSGRFIVTEIMLTLGRVKNDLYPLQTANTTYPQGKIKSSNPIAITLYIDGNPSNTLYISGGPYEFQGTSGGKYTSRVSSCPININSDVYTFTFNGGVKIQPDSTFQIQLGDGYTEGTSGITLGKQGWKNCHWILTEETIPSPQPPEEPVPPPTPPTSTITMMPYEISCRLTDRSGANITSSTQFSDSDDIVPGGKIDDNGNVISKDYKSTDVIRYWYHQFSCDMPMLEKDDADPQDSKYTLSDNEYDVNFKIYWYGISGDNTTYTTGNLESRYSEITKGSPFRITKDGNSYIVFNVYAKEGLDLDYGYIRGEWIILSCVTQYNSVWVEEKTNADGSTTEIKHTRTGTRNRGIKLYVNYIEKIKRQSGTFKITANAHGISDYYFGLNLPYHGEPGSNDIYSGYATYAGRIKTDDEGKPIEVDHYIGGRAQAHKDYQFYFFKDYNFEHIQHTTITNNSLPSGKLGDIYIIDDIILSDNFPPPNDINGLALQAGDFIIRVKRGSREDWFKCSIYGLNYLINRSYPIDLSLTKSNSYDTEKLGTADYINAMSKTYDTEIMSGNTGVGINEDTGNNNEFIIGSPPELSGFEGIPMNQYFSLDAIVDSNVIDIDDNSNNENTKYPSIENRHKIVRELREKYRNEFLYDLCGLYGKTFMIQECPQYIPYKFRFYNSDVQGRYSDANDGVYKMDLDVDLMISCAPSDEQQFTYDYFDKNGDVIESADNSLPGVILLKQEKIMIGNLRYANNTITGGYCRAFRCVFRKPYSEMKKDDKGKAHYTKDDIYYYFDIVNENALKVKDGNNIIEIPIPDNTFTGANEETGDSYGCYTKGRIMLIEPDEENEIDNIQFKQLYNGDKQSVGYGKLLELVIIPYFHFNNFERNNASVKKNTVNAISNLAFVVPQKFLILEDHDLVPKHVFPVLDRKRIKNTIYPNRKDMYTPMMLPNTERFGYHFSHIVARHWKSIECEFGLELDFGGKEVDRLYPTVPKDQKYFSHKNVDDHVLFDIGTYVTDKQRYLEILQIRPFINLIPESGLKYDRLYVNYDVEGKADLSKYLEDLDDVELSTDFDYTITNDTQKYFDINIKAPTNVRICTALETNWLRPIAVKGEYLYYYDADKFKYYINKYATICNFIYDRGDKLNVYSDINDNSVYWSVPQNEHTRNKKGSRVNGIRGMIIDTDFWQEIIVDGVNNNYYTGMITQWLFKRKEDVDNEEQIPDPYIKGSLVPWRKTKFLHEKGEYIKVAESPTTHDYLSENKYKHGTQDSPTRDQLSYYTHDEIRKLGTENNLKQNFYDILLYLSRYVTIPTHDPYHSEK